MEFSRVILLILGLLCLMLGIRTYRQGHPWLLLSLVIFNCGLTCLNIALGRIIFGEHDSFYFSNLLFPIGLFVFFKNIQTEVISKFDRYLLTMAFLDLAIGIGLCISSYFLPPEAYASHTIDVILNTLRSSNFPYNEPELGYRRLVTFVIMIFFYIQMLVMPIVLVASYVFLTKTKLNHLNFFTEDTFDFYRWSQRIVVLTFACFIIIGGLVIYSLHIEYTRFQLYFMYFLIGIAGGSFGLLSYWGPDNLLRSREFNDFLSTDMEESHKATDNIEFVPKDEYIDRLNRVMSVDRAYRDERFNLSRLANKVGISPRHMSRIINGHYNQSFSDFINHHRIEEVKKNLLAPDYHNYSIVGIGLEAGFGSKSSFYNTFKKITGKTPSQFKADQSNTGHS